MKGLHLSHADCALGRWHLGLGKAFDGDPDSEYLDIPHQSMHNVCETILAAVNSSQFNLVQLKRMLDELTDNSNRVTASLQRLEARLLMEEFQWGTNIETGPRISTFVSNRSSVWGTWNPAVASAPLPALPPMRYDEARDLGAELAINFRDSGYGVGRREFPPCGRGP